MHILKTLTPFKPTKLSGCALWLAADRGVTTVDGKVSAWADQSGNGNHAAQGTVALRPTYVASGQGSRPTVRFVNDANSNSNYDWMAVSGPVLSGDFSIFFVASRTNVSDNYDVLLTQNTPNSIFTRTGLSPGLYQSQFIGGSNVTLVSGTSYIHSVVRTGTSVYFRNNNANLASGTSSASFTLSKLGYTEYGYSFQGDCPEIIIFNRALTDAERVKVEQYLSSKFAITLS